MPLPQLPPIAEIVEESIETEDAALMKKYATHRAAYNQKFDEMEKDHKKKMATLDKLAKKRKRCPAASAVSGEATPGKRRIVFDD